MSSRSLPDTCGQCEHFQRQPREHAMGTTIVHVCTHKKAPDEQGRTYFVQPFWSPMKEALDCPMKKEIVISMFHAMKKNPFLVSVYQAEKKLREMNSPLLGLPADPAAAPTGEIPPLPPEAFSAPAAPPETQAATPPEAPPPLPVSEATHTTDTDTRDIAKQTTSNDGTADLAATVSASTGTFLM